MRVFGWSLAVIVAALSVGGLWVMRDFSMKPEIAVHNPEEAVDNLKDLYKQAESLESRIHYLRANNKSHTTEQKRLTLIRDSIESVRYKIEEQANTVPTETLPARKAININRIKKMFYSPAFLLAVIALLSISIFVAIFKNRAFGKSPERKSFPGYTVPKPSKPLKQSSIKPSPDLPARPKSVPPVKHTEFVEKKPDIETTASTAPSDFVTFKKTSDSSYHEDILALHKQGLSVKDISNRLKIEHDKVNLALRLHGE